MRAYDKTICVGWGVTHNLLEVVAQVVGIHLLWQGVDVELLLLARAIVVGELNNLCALLLALLEKEHNAAVTLYILSQSLLYRRDVLVVVERKACACKVEYNGLRLLLLLAGVAVVARGGKQRNKADDECDMSE